jgi:hypothetical protein
VTGEGNQGGNNCNDRLPGVSRDPLLGPDYATTDLRLTRRLFAGDRMKVELMAESFNLLTGTTGVSRSRRMVSSATRPSLCKRLTLLESIFFQLNAACPYVPARY